MHPPQPAPPPPFDAGNPLLGEGPAQITSALVDTPAGQRLALTIRTQSSTVTVFLQGADAKNWAAQLTRDSAAMSGAGLVVANGALAKP